MSFGMFEIAVDNIESWPPRLIALFDENMELLRSYALCRYELDNDDNWKPPRFDYYVPRSLRPQIRFYEQKQEFLDDWRGLGPAG
jgi:hypothetical protein